MPGCGGNIGLGAAGGGGIDEIGAESGPSIVKFEAPPTRKVGSGGVVGGRGETGGVGAVMIGCGADATVGITEVGIGAGTDTAVVSSIKCRRVFCKSRSFSINIFSTS